MTELKKEPLSTMDKSALDAQLEVMKKAAKLSETDKAMERSKNIADLKAILQILTHFNETKEKLHELPKEIPPRKVEEPEFIEEPVFDKEEPVLKKSEILWLVLFIVLAIGVIAVGKYNILGDGIYTAGVLISYRIGSLYTVTEVEVFAVALIVVGFIAKAAIGSSNKRKYDIEMGEYESAKGIYSAELKEIAEKNEAMHNAYVEEEEKAKAEADEKNKLTHLQSMSYQTTLKHLEADYMKKYSKYIPSEKLDIPYIKELIKVIESQEAQTIRGAVMKLDDKEEKEGENK